ncbi:MAG: PD-(D/E)XK nuclease family protein, partial [Candidatus Caldarchaeum sp.]
SELEMASTTDMQPVSFTSESAFVRGVADVVIDRGTTAFIFDFKTGKKRPKPEQLNLYAALYAVANPQTEKFVASFLWLQEKDITTYSFNKTEALRGIEWAKEVSRKIQLDMERERWQEKPSAMCRWCPAKSICPSGKRY